MGFLAYVFFAVASSLIGAALDSYLASREKGPEAQPFTPPDITPGTPIPVLFGTGRLRGIVTWMGPVRTVDVKNQVGSEFFGLIPIVKTVGKRYHITCQMVLGWGWIDDLQNVVFDPNQPLTDQPAVSGQLLEFDVTANLFGAPTVHINIQSTPRLEGWIDTFTRILHNGTEHLYFYLPKIFGGEDNLGGGGFWGHVIAHIGDSQGAPSSVMQGALGAGNVPSYRQLAYLIYDDVVVGTRPQVPPVDWIYTSSPFHPAIPGGLGKLTGGNRGVNFRLVITRSALVFVTVGGASSWQCSDACAMYIFLAVCVDRRYGLGRSLDEFDLHQLNDVGITTDSEGLGASPILDGTKSAASATINEMLAIINGVVLRDPTTNKIQVKLLRAEDVSTMRSFGPTEIIEADLTHKVLEDTFNELTVFFNDADLLYEQNFVTVRDAGNVAATGTIRPASPIHLPSVTFRPQAMAIAIRELKAVSIPLISGTVKYTRAAWDLERGDVCKNTMPDLDFVDLQLRVRAVNLGNPQDNHVIATVVEDVFASEDPVVSVVADGTGDITTVPPSAATKQLPTIIPSQRQAGFVGTLDLVTADPDSAITQVAVSTSVGGGTPSAYTPITGPLYEATVALITDNTSSIAWRVTYDLGDGPATTGGTVTFTPPGSTEQTLVDSNPLIWDITGKTNDSASVVISGNRTLVVVGAVAGFRGKLLITSSNAAGNVLTLPAGSIIDGGGTTVTLGFKDQLSMHYDGTYYWWSHDTSSNTVPLVPLAASVSSTMTIVATLFDLRASISGSGSGSGDLST